ncbi:MAG TPA: hypothetical protein VGJ92_11925 [Methanocella sp.]
MASALTSAEDDWNPPPPPAMDGGGSSGGSGGGGGGGGSYTPPAFNPYTLNVTSSNNSGFGSMDVKDYYTVSVRAGRDIPVGGNNTSIGLTADLSSAPSAISLDIVPLDVSTVDLPFDLGDFSSLLAFNMTRGASSGEWPMKAGTVHMTFKMPLDTLSGIDLNSTFYLMKNDGTSFIMYAVVPTIENGMALFDVPLSYEASSPSTSGTFMLTGPRTGTSAGSTATPVPATPTPVPATPTPKSGSNVGVLLLVAALGIAAIFISRSRKQ